MSAPLVPTYNGFVGSNLDALLIIEASLNNELPLVLRRPVELERANLIRLGHVFVFVEKLSEIKRWTDGIAWSASRILGRFLIYRALDKPPDKSDKRKGRKNSKGKEKDDYEPYPRPYKSVDYSGGSHKPYSSSLSGSSLPFSSLSSSLSFSNLSSCRSSASSAKSLDVAFNFTTQAELIVDEALIKKTISLTVYSDSAEEDSKQTVHLISYFSAHDVLTGRILRPTQTSLKNVMISSRVWQALKRSSLGGKFPLENEANFFLDSNYQLQNMSILSSPSHVAKRLANRRINSDSQIEPYKAEDRVFKQEPSDYFRNERYQPSALEYPLTHRKENESKKRRVLQDLDPKTPSPEHFPESYIDPSYGLHYERTLSPSLTRFQQYSLYSPENKQNFFAPPLVEKPEGNILPTMMANPKDTPVYDNGYLCPEPYRLMSYPHFKSDHQNHPNLPNQPVQSSQNLQSHQSAVPVPSQYQNLYQHNFPFDNFSRPADVSLQNRPLSNVAPEQTLNNGLNIHASGFGVQGQSFLSLDRKFYKNKFMQDDKDGVNFGASAKSNVDENELFNTGKTIQ